MTAEKDLADEEGRVIEALRSGAVQSGFDDDLHARLFGAFADGEATALDKAVLLRQLLRRWSLRDGRAVPVELTESLSRSLREVADKVGLRCRQDGLWTADPWDPNWLECDGGGPDGAALAGTVDGIRVNSEPVQADPFFEEIAGFRTYKTPGQRAACRAVMTAVEGSTIISMLPTGSGKTEIALCLSKRSKFGVTMIVVPTVALAYDFERRFRVHFAKMNPRIDPSTLNFAWTASTDDATRERLKTAVTAGRQPILVTSPESMTRALRQTLIDAASIGRLQGFVIDEAHLVTQWGRAFRPEFLVLADFRNDLMAMAAARGHSRAVTLLLSATLGSSEIEDLTRLFGGVRPCSLIIANTLRPEPDMWIARAEHKTQREVWVQETLAHCARPAVLYVTKPDEASWWVNRLKGSGYRRIAMVTGESTAGERRAVLDGIRATPDAERPIDLVVATSAFGLGIDYAHIRSVIHACLPETVDRWYQELGRSGRDGNASAEFLITAPGDEAEAEDLGVRVLTPSVAKRRWEDLWDHRETLNGQTFVDLEGSWGPGRGDYNRRWNAQLIQGLVELGELRRQQFDIEAVRDLPKQSGTRPSEWIAIERTQTGLGMSTFWDERWLQWQQEESGQSKNSLQRMRDVAWLRTAACKAISEAYAPTPDLQEEWGSSVEFMEPLGPCGRCPACRKDGQAAFDHCPPNPEQTWSVESLRCSEHLENFAASCRGQNGLALLVYDNEDTGLVMRIATGLLGIGVRHFGGLPAPVEVASGEPVFIDELPLSPMDLTPLPSFSYFSPGQSVSAHWLARRDRGRARGSEAVGPIDVLMLPAESRIGSRLVGRDLPALRAGTAAELLLQRI